MSNQLPDNIDEQLRTAANDFFKNELEDLVEQRNSIENLITELKTNLDFLKRIVPGNAEEVAVEEAEIETQNSTEDAVDAPEDGAIEVAGEEDEVSSADDEDTPEVAEETAEEPVAEVQEAVAPVETPESLGLDKQVFTPEEDASKVSEEAVVKDTEIVLDSSTEDETPADNTETEE